MPGRPLDHESPLKGIYAIVDPEQCRGRSPIEVAEAILDGVPALLQLRVKNGSDSDFLKCAKAIATLCSKAGVPFFVNDRPDIAALSQATGVHLGQDDLPPESIATTMPKLAIGYSCHGLEQVERAQTLPVALLGFGPVFGTTTKKNPDATVGTSLLREAAVRTSIPLVAIGGIGAHNIAEVADTGVDLAACVSAICSADDPGEATRLLKERFFEASPTMSSRVRG